MNKSITALVVCVLCAAVAWAHGQQAPSDPATITPFAAATAPAGADTTGTVGPPPAAVTAIIFKTSCGRCHGSDRPAIALSLKSEDFAAATIDVPSREIKELKLVDTKDPDKSYLLMKIRGDEGIIGERMPMGSKALDEQAIATVETWILEVSAAAAADTAAAAESGAQEALEAEEETPAAPEAEGEAQPVPDEAE